MNVRKNMVEFLAINIMLTGSNNQFQNYESGFSRIFPLIRVLQVFLGHVYHFFVNNDLIDEIFFENSGLLVLEMIGGLLGMD